jgi:hypothetical protein
MKKYLIIIILLNATHNCTSQTIDETKSYITKNINELILERNFTKTNENGDLIKKANGEYEYILGYKSLLSFKKNYLIIKEIIYDNDYMIKNNLKDSISYTLINISKIISYNVEYFLNDGLIEFETKENGIKILNEKEFHSFLVNPNFKFFKKNNKEDNYTSISFIYTSDLENTKLRTKKAFKHLVKLYGGKIIDDLF